MRISIAAIYEIIRQGRRNLVMGRKTAVHDVDILVASGCVNRLLMRVVD